MVVGAGFEGLAKAEDFGFSMPQEYLNYTVTVENGTLWAKIDGVYPMHLDGANGTAQLPMVYPTPPSTTNMHVYLNDVELSWSNYSELYPSERHYTDIGNWQMIYTVIAPAAPDFVLGIHYEHPVELINGTYMLLYDLNIKDYLSPQTPKSTAHFNIRIEANISAVKVYATGTTGFRSNWSPVTYNGTEDEGVRIVEFDVVSEYAKPLWGDIIVELVDTEIPELQLWTVLIVAGTAGLTGVVFQKHVKRNRQLTLR